MLCQDCPKKSECVELCVEAELYVNQDHVGRDELPTEDVDCTIDWPDPTKNTHLTPREKEILTLLGRGLNRFDVCQVLGISRHNLRECIRRLKKMAR